jgi:hypothetical protein
MKELDMYKEKAGMTNRAGLYLGMWAMVVSVALAGCASDPRSGDQRREDARTCARLGTTGSGTVTCMMLQPRERERREREESGY